ncbi:hypothetical protein [Jiella sp. M17.18]|uniref:hypothetical protein n=1 Tax=Jiella sp. M17.18 TaxID=3234247 RepID=UPI0034DE80B3
MPTLLRLLTTLAIIVAIIYGIMAALVYFVEPTRREVTVTVPLPQLQPESTATLTGTPAAAGAPAQ